MGTELLVASLWVAVLVYWLWTRRPTTGDTVGLFRYELRALRQATPARVAPANRMVPARPAPAIGMQGSGFVPAPAGRPLSDHLAAAAATHRKMVMRRRRRDVLCALGGAAGIFLALAALTGSTMVIGLQVLADVGLGGYVVMLGRTARAGGAAPANAHRTAAAGGSVARAVRSRHPGRARAQGAPELWAPDGLVHQQEQQLAVGSLEQVRVPGPHLFDQAAYLEQVGRGGRGRVHPSPPVAAYAGAPQGGPYASQAEDEGVYGDFDSYASLALAN